MCLRIMVGDPCIDDISAQSAAHSLSLSTVLHASTPPPTFCNAVLKLASFLMQALGQYSFSLEFLCSVEGIGPTADRLEAVLCHVLIPLFLRAATASKGTRRCRFLSGFFLISFCNAHVKAVGRVDFQEHLQSREYEMWENDHVI
uniref:Protein UNC80 C-terminal domain-containing protein n=1 Tax=Parascaris equorum TaxID=6256 RepID=A0A914RUT7_PAREQ